MKSEPEYRKEAARMRMLAAGHVSQDSRETMLRMAHWYDHLAEVAAELRAKTAP